MDIAGYMRLAFEKASNRSNNDPMVGYSRQERADKSRLKRSNDQSLTSGLPNHSAAAENRVLHSDVLTSGGFELVRDDLEESIASSELSCSPFDLMDFHDGHFVEPFSNTAERLCKSLDTTNSNKSGANQTLVRSLGTSSSDVASQVKASQQTNNSIDAKTDVLKTKFLSAWTNMRNGWVVKTGTNFKTDSPIWILGVKYCFHQTESADSKRKGPLVISHDNMTALEQFKLDFRSRLWLTYRQEFPPLISTHLTSDVGWGCMIRSGQMLLAQTLVLHALGRDWRMTDAAVDKVALHRKIIQYFGDSPSPLHPLSLHNLTACGLRLGKNPGDWYGPSSVALVLRDALNVASSTAGDDLLSSFTIHVSVDGTVYLEDILDTWTTTQDTCRPPVNSPLSNCDILSSEAAVTSANATNATDFSAYLTTSEQNKVVNSKDMRASENILSAAAIASPSVEAIHAVSAAANALSTAKCSSTATSTLSNSVPTPNLCAAIASRCSSSNAAAAKSVPTSRYNTSAVPTLCAAVGGSRMVSDPADNTPNISTAITTSIPAYAATCVDSDSTNRTTRRNIANCAAVNANMTDANIIIANSAATATDTKNAANGKAYTAVTKATSTKAPANANASNIIVNKATSVNTASNANSSYSTNANSNTEVNATFANAPATNAEANAAAVYTVVDATSSNVNDATSNANIANDYDDVDGWSDTSDLLDWFNVTNTLVTTTTLPITQRSSFSKSTVITPSNTHQSLHPTAHCSKSSCNAPSGSNYTETHSSKSSWRAVPSDASYYQTNPSKSASEVVTSSTNCDDQHTQCSKDLKPDLNHELGELCSIDQNDRHTLKSCNQVSPGERSDDIKHFEGSDNISATHNQNSNIYSWHIASAGRILPYKISNKSSDRKLESNVYPVCRTSPANLLRELTLNEQFCDVSNHIEELNLSANQQKRTVDQEKWTANIAQTDKQWKSLLLLIPVRLGGVTMNPAYWSSLKNILMYDMCVGIIGGRPKHSLYFIGWQDDRLLHLDPHCCQDTVDVTQSNFSLETYHCPSPRKLLYTKMDPSCAIGFYCKTRADFERLIRDTPTLTQCSLGDSYSLFRFEEGRRSDAEKDMATRLLHLRGNAARLTQNRRDSERSEDFMFI